MATLEELSILRAGAKLKPIPGNSWQEQLVNARDMAKNVLLKYIPDLQFDMNAALQANSEVDGWVDRNYEYLRQMFADTAQENVPEELQLRLGTSLYRNWIIAHFTLAAYGMGPWQSGYVVELVNNPNSDITEAWAKEDAGIRLQLFQYILLLEEQGDLGRVLTQTEVGGSGGEGEVVLSASVIILIVLLAAIIAAALIYYNLADRNNKMMERLCENAKKEGREDVVKECIAATKDLSLKGPFSGVTSEIGKIVMVLGGIVVGVYVVTEFALPKIFKALEKRGETP